MRVQLVCLAICLCMLVVNVALMLTGNTVWFAGVAALFSVGCAVVPVVNLIRSLRPRPARAANALVNGGHHDA